jgi:catechol 2,3-dioxygenase-like lactoylglutathione lyase family enzyme
MNHIHLKSRDARKAAQWYVENFGARIVEEVSINGPLTVRTDLGGVRINITEPPPSGLPASDSSAKLGLEHFGIETDDLDGVMASLQKKRVKVLEPIRTLPTGMRIAFVEAPDNVRLELMQPL